MITAIEQIDTFYLNYSYDLNKLINNIKDELRMEGSLILNNESINLNKEFIDLILNSINLKKLFIKDKKL